MFTRYKARVDRALYTAVSSPQGMNPAGDSEPGIYNLLRYHLGWADPQGMPLTTSTFQGKALRPTLCLFACESLGGNLDQASQAAAALELVHNFSLIHDDIQDEDVERRHQSTVWHLWGVPRALTAGNAMRCVADMALLQVSQLDVAPQTTLKVSELLTESYLKMIQGQCLDLEYETRTSINTGDYLHMIAYKTGALIRTGLEMGALLASEDPAPVQGFARFGDYLGQVFQIRDDYLGIWGDETTTGKAAGNDIRRRKKSFPVVYALERTQGRARETLLRIYGQESLNEDDVAAVMHILQQVGAAEYAQRLTAEAADRARQSLQGFPLPSWARTEGERLVEFLSGRLY